MAIADAVQRRVNVLVEGTMRNPDVVAKTLRDFRGAGFETDARALAVSPELSSLGILQRYAAQKESRGVGRMTTSEAHQAAVTGMLATRSEEHTSELQSLMRISYAVFCLKKKKDKTTKKLDKIPPNHKDHH